ncbi:endolytic peptidoglycan transglycosylase RlpA [Enterobacteriaceae bacterium ESL0689]|nr:endolytic peptidoglycan transglycosylase RlpA [Enterobacteriaceae bacterium ESL0689]
MRKQWPGICLITVLLTACIHENEQQKTISVPQPVVCHGPVVEISGVEPHYEALVVTANQDYEHHSERYKIVSDPARFTQTGLAAIYDAEPASNLTVSGELFDPTQLSAAHPTLPIPSYIRVTNLANGRMLVVRINDRGPYGSDRIISLSRAVADRLNMSNNTRVRIDPIIVAEDGSLSGPGMACTTVAKQTYALPPRPDLNAGTDTMPVSPAPTDIHAVSDTTLTPPESISAPLTHSDIPDTPVSLTPPVPQSKAPHKAATTAVKQTQVSAPPSRIAGNIVLQVGAISDPNRARHYQQKLSQQLSVPGRVVQNGPLWRIQLGPFSNREQASTLQQRLQNEMQIPSFITAAQ